jgi:hypothetical protein
MSVNPSYVKTTIACAALAAASLAIALLGLALLPRGIAVVVAVLCTLATLAAAALAGGGAIVIVRCKREARGERDLFLELNRSREAASIEQAGVRTTAVRRWLARRLLGHDFVVGDLVEVKSWSEIRATLDAEGRLEHMPFMREMLGMCGRRARVFRCVHRLFDHRKTRRMRHMNGGVLLVGAVCDGAAHGGCEAACHVIFKTDWLRRVGADDAAADEGSHASAQQADTAVLQAGTTPPYYSCQITQLHDASQALSGWGVARFFLPVVTGNVTLGAFAVGWLTHLFNEAQHLRGGVAFPAFAPASGEPERGAGPRLVRDDEVVVRSPAEIRRTLNDDFMHRGLWFEPDMLKHCGQRYRVQADVTKLIDIVTGEMLTMRTPAYILRDVHFSGERQLFNAQWEPLFWRSVWLTRTDIVDAHTVERALGGTEVRA